MPTNSWTPNSQFLSTVLNDPSAIPSHAAPASHGTTPPRPRQVSGQLQQAQPQQPLTAAQRSAQARGKAYNIPVTTTPGGRARASEAESYASRQKRDEAAAILDSQEMLLWYSAARNESVTQTRRYYTNIVLGVPEAPRVWREKWEVEAEDASVSPKAKGKGKEKERERERGSGGARKRYSADGPYVMYAQE